MNDKKNSNRIHRIFKLFLVIYPFDGSAPTQPSLHSGPIVFARSQGSSKVILPEVQKSNEKETSYGYQHSNEENSKTSLDFLESKPSVESLTKVSQDFTLKSMTEFQKSKEVNSVQKISEVQNFTIQSNEVNWIQLEDVILLDDYKINLERDSFEVGRLGEKIAWKLFLEEKFPKYSQIVWQNEQEEKGKPFDFTAIFEETEVEIELKTQFKEKLFFPISYPQLQEAFRQRKKYHIILMQIDHQHSIRFAQIVDPIDYLYQQKLQLLLTFSQ